MDVKLVGRESSEHLAVGRSSNVSFSYYFILGTRHLGVEPAPSILSFTKAFIQEVGLAALLLRL